MSLLVSRGVPVLDAGIEIGNINVVKTVQSPRKGVGAAPTPERSPVANTTPIAREDAAENSTVERHTRTDVIRCLLSHGPSTAAHVARELQLSGTAVRRHLDVLVEEGAVATRDETVVGRRGRGRPAQVFLLTDIGRSQLPHAYDELAEEALSYLAENVGDQAVADFARRRAQRIVEGVRDDLEAATTVGERARILARALSTSGFAASVDAVGIGQQLSQHHCPVSHVAGKYPQLCEQELSVFSEVLGTHAQRLATIARGDSFCTTFIPDGSDNDADEAGPQPPGNAS